MSNITLFLQESIKSDINHQSTSGFHVIMRNSNGNAQ